MALRVRAAGAGADGGEGAGGPRLVWDALVSAVMCSPA